MMSQAAGWPHWEADMEQLQGTSAGDLGAAVLVAIELSKANWLLAVHDPATGKVSRRRVDGGDADALIAVLARCQRDAQTRVGEVVGIECVFEAGYDGFWLHRRLAQAGIACRVMDPASLKVDRRARRVKTDRVDAESLLRALQAWRRGPGGGATGTRARSFVCPASRRRTRAGRTVSSRG
jgi:transposase